MRVVIAAVVLLMLAGAAFADVNNVNLAPVSNSGVSGTATTISGQYGGVTPHTHVEVNARLNQMPASGMVYEAWLVDNQSNTKQSLGVLEGNMLSANMNLTQFSDSGPWDSVAISMESANDTNPMPGRIVALGNLPGSDVSSNDFMSAAVLPQDEMLQRQFAMQRFNLTSNQVMDLRMQALTYQEISLVGNIAMQCNRSPQEVARQYMESGANLAAVASTCNTTVAQLLTPVPFTAVAGFQGQVTPLTPVGIPAPSFYLMRPNGARVLTYSQWQRFRDAGYSWEEVAVAANISQQTGERVGDILMMTKLQGQTFQQIALSRNLRWDEVSDVSRWPWERDGQEVVVYVTPQGQYYYGPGTMGVPGTFGTAGPINNQGPMTSPSVPNY